MQMFVYLAKMSMVEQSSVPFSWCINGLPVMQAKKIAKVRLKSKNPVFSFPL